MEQDDLSLRVMNFLQEADRPPVALQANNAPSPNESIGILDQLHKLLANRPIPKTDSAIEFWKRIESFVDLSFRLKAQNKIHNADMALKWRNTQILLMTLLTSLHDSTMATELIKSSKSEISSLREVVKRVNETARLLGQIVSAERKKVGSEYVVQLSASETAITNRLNAMLTALEGKITLSALELKLLEADKKIATARIEVNFFKEHHHDVVKQISALEIQRNRAMAVLDQRTEVVTTMKDDNRGVFSRGLQGNQDYIKGQQKDFQKQLENDKRTLLALLKDLSLATKDVPANTKSMNSNTADATLKVQAIDLGFKSESKSESSTDYSSRATALGSGLTSVQTALKDVGQSYETVGKMNATFFESLNNSIQNHFKLIDESYSQEMTALETTREKRADIFDKKVAFLRSVADILRDKLIASSVALEEGLTERKSLEPLLVEAKALEKKSKAAQQADVLTLAENLKKTRNEFADVAASLGLISDASFADIIRKILSCHENCLYYLQDYAASLATVAGQLSLMADTFEKSLLDAEKAVRQPSPDAISLAELKLTAIDSDMRVMLPSKPAQIQLPFFQ